jgi:hypothetical protein
LKETIVVMLSAALGVKAGRLLGEEIRRRKNAEAKAEDLRLNAPTSEHHLRGMRKVLNDAHKRILAVSKALQKPPR